MAVTHQEMQPFAARLRTFEAPQQIRKRQASGAAKKKGGNTAEWPHEKPDPVLLARAGFFYRPDQESFDNVVCFLCNVRLDGWEETDVPIQEHLAHTRYCPWATAASVFRNEDDPEPEVRDPLSEEMCEARKATYATGEGWPHESKKGWKCKITKMVDAGWCWDPSAEEGDGVDGVTCFYCGLSLDGWEPKDDPFQEHKRREPGCRFFELLGHFHGADAANGKIKKSKATGKGARASTASKASRISTVSAMSAMSDVPSMPGSYIDPLEELDDSNVTTATNASQATATKGKKKTTRTKATAKGTKGRKKASVLEESAEEGVQYPDLGQDVEEELPVAAKKTKKGTRASKQIDSSVIEISQSEMFPPKKPTRGGTRKDQKEPEDEPPQLDVPVPEADAQLQEELEHASELFAPGDESTPAAERTKPKRGVKRTSDGQRKQQVIESSVVDVDTSMGSNAEPAAKRKRGRPKKASNMSADAKVDATIDDDLPATQEDPIGLDQSEVEAKPAKKAPAKKGKGRPKGKKTSNARSSRSSKASVTAPEQDDAEEEPEDLARDQMEIEAELARIAAEQASQQAVQEEQDEANEYEPSPSSGRVSKDSAELQKLQDEVQADEKVETEDNSPPRQSYAPAGVTPSPNGSDKENIRSSFIEPSAKQAQQAVVLSPTKTIKIPLAASTPNRSPGKTILSPSKHISHLSSTTPWNAIDLDTALVQSENAQAGEPGDLSELLHDAAGGLKSPEKRMTVEEWVRHRAEKGEEDLKKRCELMVSTFEKAGMKALESVHGIQVIA